jgi:hypothetical protein
MFKMHKLLGKTSAAEHTRVFDNNKWKKLKDVEKLKLY